MFDIDDFKVVNDTYGHAVGDLVLETIGAILKSETTGYGTCYRYGGEELCCILPGLEFQVCIDLAEEMRKAIAAHAWENHMKVTISGGIAESIHGENVFSRADNLLYYSKRNGKNQITTKEQ